MEKNFLVVRSSAGSGKTYTLVREYLLMLLKSKDPRYYRNILAITFTNKATNEMKERILEALYEISIGHEEKNDLLEQLSERLGTDKDDVIRRSGMILRQLIHDYAEFSISTIDRFVYRLIRSFSFELNIPSNMEIELNRDRILQKSIDSLFERMNSDPDLASLLIEFSRFKFASDKSFNLEKDLMEMAGEVINTRTEPFLKELAKIDVTSFADIKKRLISNIKTIEKALKSKAEELLNVLVNAGFDSSDLVGGQNGIFGYLSKFIEGEGLKEPGKTVLKLREEGKWKGSKISQDKAMILESMSAELNEKLESFFSDLELSGHTYHFCEIMLTRLHSMALVSAIHKEINNYKEENDISQLDDFNNLISKLIDENPVPYIFERTGDKFNHFLIDEFQDTSQIQWFNLLPLIENGLSEGHNSLIVGDAKQAIYRWRGGDAGQLTELPKLNFQNKDEVSVAMRQEVLTSFYDDDNLEDNWRSSETVVSFVNDFFEKLKGIHPDELSHVFKSHEQNVKKHLNQGSVDIRFLDKDADEEDRLSEMTERIRHFVSLGYSYADVVVLCRKKSQCTQVADHLIQEGIPIISSESLKLASSEEVNFLLNWIFYLFDASQKDRAYKVLQYLSFNDKLGSIHSDDLLLRWWNKASFEEILNIVYPDISVGELQSMSLLELCAFLSHHFLGENMINSFVLNFMDNVSRFQSQWGNDLMEFINWWEENGEDLNVEMPEAIDSVRIMTIHKAKGLEFNIVILPFMNDTIKAGESHFWEYTRGEDEEIMPLAWLPANKYLLGTRYSELYENEMIKSFIDSVNLMYVAMTRAAHHLCILSENNPKKDNIYKEENLLWHCFGLKDYHGTEEEGRFFIGSADIIKKKALEEESNAMNLSVPEDIDWRKRLQLKYRIESNVLSDEVLTAQEFGNLIHDILSNIEVLDELSMVMDQYELRGLLTPKQKDLLQESIRATLSSSDILPYFEGKNLEVFNERDLLSDEGQVLRPDRMVLTIDKAVLIDFKTGMPDLSHEQQMKQYGSVISSLGDWKVESYLVYFASGQVNRVA